MHFGMVGGRDRVFFWIYLDFNFRISVDFWLIGFMDKWKSIIKALTNAMYVFISEYKYLPNMQDPISLRNKGIATDMIRLK